MYSKCWHYIHRNALIDQAGNAFQYYVCIKEREPLQFRQSCCTAAFAQENSGNSFGRWPSGYVIFICLESYSTPVMSIGMILFESSCNVSIQKCYINDTLLFEFGDFENLQLLLHWP